MKNLSVYTGIICFTLALLLQPATGAVDWEIEKDNDGIITYSRDVEGSRYKAFKATAVINASMAAIGAVLRDTPVMKEWMDGVISSKVLRQYNSNDMDLYMVMDFPWPADDRDAIISAKTSVALETGDITTTSQLITDPEIPDKEEYVRLPKMYQQINMSYKAHDKTEVIFSIHLETGGNLKAFMVNGELAKIPRKILENLEEFVKNDKYYNADPLHPDNIDVARTSIRNRAKQTYKDEAILDFLTSDNELMMIAIESGPSKEGTKKTARAITKKYVKTPMFAKLVETHIADRKDKTILAKAVSDEKFISALIDDLELYELVISEGEINDRVVNIIIARTLENLN